MIKKKIILDVFQFKPFRNHEKLNRQKKIPKSCANRHEMSRKGVNNEMNDRMK